MNTTGPELSVYFMDSPMGLLKLEGDSNGMCSVDLVGCNSKPSLIGEIPKVLADAVLQLSEYFQHKRKVFDLPLNPSGTEFQREVWEGLLTIPFGDSVSYKDLATKIGKPKSTRPAANAIGRNPLLIIIPCHRVIGSDGSLTGFSSGLLNKKWLLKHEGAACVQ